MQRSSAPAAQHLLSIGQAADEFSVSKKTIRRRIADGTIPAVRVGSRIIRVSREDLARIARPIPTTAGPRDGA